MGISITFDEKRQDYVVRRAKGTFEFPALMSMPLHTLRS